MFVNAERAPCACNKELFNKMYLILVKKIFLEQLQYSPCQRNARKFVFCEVVVCVHRFCLIAVQTKLNICVHAHIYN